MDNSLVAKLLEDLKNGLQIAYRTRNNQALFSLMNRPSAVDDHALATALVFAGNKFKIVVDATIAKKEKVERTDSRTVTYDEAMSVDWKLGVIRTSRRETLTLQVLQAVIGDLMRGAKAPTPATLVKPN